MESAKSLSAGSEDGIVSRQDVQLLEMQDVCGRLKQKYAAQNYDVSKASTDDTGVKPETPAQTEFTPEQRGDIHIGTGLLILAIAAGVLATANKLTNHSYHNGTHQPPAQSKR